MNNVDRMIAGLRCCALQTECAGKESDYSESRAGKIAAIVEIVPEEVAK